MSSVAGFAVIEKGRLLVATVAETAVQAMGNWLADRSPGMPSGVSESYLRRSFSQIAEMRGAELVPVTILQERRVSRASLPPPADEGEAD